MHIFLTGEIQVGKSTIIRRLIATLNLSSDGFMTFWEAAGGINRALYLAPYSQEAVSDERYYLALHGGVRLQPTDNTRLVFDQDGVEILKSSGRRDVLVMDELGFLESEASLFQQAVLRHLDGDAPVLGVIKPRNTPFLDSVRAHPNVRVCCVTEENRNAVFDQLFAELSPLPRGII